MEPQQVGDLQIGQDLQQERLTWRIERWAWVAISLILLSALAGLLGAGPLSNATAGEQGSALQVEYNRFARYQGRSSLRVHVAKSGEPGEEVRLWVNREFIERVEVQSIDPRPYEVQVDAGRQLYVFRAPRLQGVTTVTFRFEADHVGKMRVEMGLENGPSVQFGQFYYP